MEPTHEVFQMSKKLLFKNKKNLQFSKYIKYKKSKIKVFKPDFDVFEIVNEKN